MRPDQTIKNRDGTVKCIVRHRSMADVQTAINAALNRSKSKRSRSIRTDGDAEDFTGTKDMPAYLDMLENGWAHGVKDVEGLDGLSTDHAERTAFTRAVAGAFPIVPAYLAGAPDSMYMPTRQRSDNVRGLTLVVDSCFSYSTRSDTVLRYAREVMKLVAWLAAEQIETAVYTVVPILLGSKRVMYVTPIREAGQLLAPERVASILHPSWLRRAWFAMLEHDYHERDVADARACLSSYGNVTHADGDELRAAIPEAYSVILLPKVGIHDPAKALREAVTLKLQRGELS